MGRKKELCLYLLGVGSPLQGWMTMKKNQENKVTEGIVRVIKGLETLIALILIIAVVMSVKDLVTIAFSIFRGNSFASRDMVKELLAHSLMLIVGLELAEMLIRHKLNCIIEVMFYAVARKMLISSETALEILVGVFALAILFATRRFLTTREEEHTEDL